MIRPIAMPTTGRLPNFLLIGAMKAGTTSLYHYLKAHPQVYVPSYKAPEFFVEESNFHRGVNWYRKQFVGAKQDQIAIGEASNAYAKFPRFAGVPKRIAEHVPDVRLIYVVRDPLDRIRSHYRTRYAEGIEKSPIDQAVLENPIYLNYSLYAMQIEQYLEYFSSDQMLVITAESLRRVRRGTMERVFRFLEIDDTLCPAEIHREFYQTKDRAVRSPVPLWLRKGLKKHVPVSKRFKELENNTLRFARRFVPERLQKTDNSPPAMMSASVQAQLTERLADDVRRLKKYVDHEFDGWGIA